jgi:hypothetical protein
MYPRPSSLRLRFLVALHALSVCLMPVLLGAAATPARAQLSVNPVVCTGLDQTTFSPPLTNTSQSVQLSVAVSYTNCVTTDGSGITSGSAQEQPVVTASCLQPLAQNPEALVIHWSNGQTSTFYNTSTLTRANGELAVLRTGTISAGRYVGQTAIELSVITNLSQQDFLTQCASGGVPAISGPTTLTIAPAL